MGRGVVGGFAFVVAGSDDDAVMNNYCANRNITFFGGKARLFKGNLHGLFMADGHGGGGGIRTHGDLRLTRFPSVPIRPLSHPSRDCVWKVIADTSMVTQRYRYGTLPSSEVAVGSCATDARESGQGRKTAAFIGNV